MKIQRQMDALRKKECREILTCDEDPDEDEVEEKN